MKAGIKDHRRSRSKPRRSARRQAAATLGAGGQQAGNAYVIRASKTRYGSRPRGKLQFAQMAIAALFPAALPKHVNKLKLTRDVNRLLARDPRYLASGYGELDRMTVGRALQALLDANR